MAWTPYTLPTAVKPAKNPTDEYFGRTPEAAEVIKPGNLPKIPGADPMLRTAFDMAQVQNAARQADLAKFRETWGAATDYSPQEVGDVSRIYSPGGYEADLAGIRSRRQAGMSELSDAILGDLRRALNTTAVGRGRTGLGSYLGRLAASASARQRAGDVADTAAQERADLGALMAARAAMQGRRQALQDSAISRLLQPAQFEGAGLDTYQNAITRALQNALANTTQFYGYGNAS